MKGQKNLSLRICPFFSFEIGNLTFEILHGIPHTQNMADQSSTNQTNSTTQSSQNVDINTPYTPRRPAPLISVSVNHPFATGLRKIRNFLIHKQTLFSTTFSIKITPIVAIVSLFGLASLFGGGITTAFTIGKNVEEKFLTSLPTPTPKVIIKNTTITSVSRAGTIRATYQLPPDTTSASTTDVQTPIPTVYIQDATTSAYPTIKPSVVPSTMPKILHYIFVSRSSSIIFLSFSPAIPVNMYLGHTVLITGNLDTVSNILTVAKAGDIEVLK